MEGLKTVIDGLGLPGDSMKELIASLYSIVSMNTIPRPETVTTAGGAYIENRYITQDIEIEILNQFHGDRAGQLKSRDAMSDATYDITGELTRALSFVR
jgi:hypothetical protein